MTSMILFSHSNWKYFFDEMICTKWNKEFSWKNLFQKFVEISRTSKLFPHHYLIIIENHFRSIPPKTFVPFFIRKSYFGIFDSILGTVGLPLRSTYSRKVKFRNIPKFWLVEVLLTVFFPSASPRFLTPV